MGSLLDIYGGYAGVLILLAFVLVASLFMAMVMRHQARKRQKPVQDTPMHPDAFHNVAEKIKKTRLRGAIYGGVMISFVIIAILQMLGWDHGGYR
ncbi:MAG: hypothetical protein AAF352_06915 [Pseudomonadota bacterium]